MSAARTANKGSVVMDIPQAWAFVRTTSFPQHHPQCSWRQFNGALLCDCAVLSDEYARRRAAYAWAYARAAAPGGNPGEKGEE